MNIKPFRAAYPDGDLIASVDSFLSNVKYRYHEFARNGFFQRSEKDALFAYEIISRSGLAHRGLVASADLNEYYEGNIAIHEHTINSKEQQQMELILQRNAMVKPILLCFKGERTFSRLVDQAIAECEKLYEVTLEKDGSKHVFYRIDQSKLMTDLIAFFEERVPKVYIADGHHRTAATARLQKKHLEEPNKHPGVPGILAGFFPFDQMEVHDYNRVLEVLNSITPTLLIARLSKFANIEPLNIPGKPEAKGELTFLIKGEWYSLKWREKVLKKYAAKGLDNDYHLFNELVLKEVLEIEDVRSDNRIKYVEGPLGLSKVIERSKKNDLRIAFCLYPLKLEDMVHIADINQTLPPKSTWFEPRLKNGLIVQEI